MLNYFHNYFYFNYIENLKSMLFFKKLIWYRNIVNK